LRKRSTGQSIVEFALIAPILLLFIFGIIDMARLIQAQVTVSNAARTGIRWASTGQRELNPDGVTYKDRIVSIKEKTKAAMTGLPLSTTSYSDEFGFYSIDINPSDGAGPNEHVEMRVYYNVEMLTPLVNLVLPRVLVKGYERGINEEWGAVQTFNHASLPPAPPDPPTWTPAATRTPFPPTQTYIAGLTAVAQTSTAIVAGTQTSVAAATNTSVAATATVWAGQTQTSVVQTVVSANATATSVVQTALAVNATNTSIAQTVTAVSVNATATSVVQTAVALNATNTSVAATTTAIANPTNTAIAKTATAAANSTNTSVAATTTAIANPTNTAIAKTATASANATNTAIAARLSFESVTFVKPDGTNPIDVRVTLVDGFGNAVTGATVTVTRPVGLTNTLTGGAGGVYSGCNLGSYSGNNGGDVTITITATKAGYQSVTITVTNTEGNIC
jgi:hypothetical protein